MAILVCYDVVQAARDALASGSGGGVPQADCRWCAKSSARYLPQNFPLGWGLERHSKQQLYLQKWLSRQLACPSWLQQWLYLVDHATRPVGSFCFQPCWRYFLRWSSPRSTCRRSWVCRWCASLVLYMSWPHLTLYLIALMSLDPSFGRSDDGQQLRWFVPFDRVNRQTYRYHLAQGYYYRDVLCLLVLE